MKETNSAPAAAPVLETALLGGGCFWCLEAVFREVEGVHAVRSGYAGGQLDAPTYRQVCTGDSGHVEVLKVDFDPARVSYRALLEIFFVIHDPTTLDRQGNDVGTQYRSVIFTTSAEQLRVARALIDELTAGDAFAQPIVTVVAEAPRFWPAEVEHDDYYANNRYQPYCQYVIDPKLAKFRQHFAALRRRTNG